MHERCASWRCKQPLHVECATQAGPPAVISIAVIESIRCLTSDFSTAWHFSHHENCFFVQRSGVAPQCLTQTGPLVVNMWPYRTIGKTCMHSLAARPSSMVHTADVRWYVKAAASPVLPHARVCITSTLRVQTECYGYSEYLPVHCIRDERQ